MASSWKKNGFFIIGILSVLFVTQISSAQTNGCLCVPSSIKISQLTFRGGVAGFSDNIAVPFNFQDFTSACLQPSEVRIIVTVTRKNGHVDSNDKNPFVMQIVNNSSGGVPTVEVPRGALETDPVKYSVTITVTKFRVGITPVTQFSANVGSVKTIPQITSQTGQTQACAPKVNSALIQFVSKATNGVDDLVKVSWNQQAGCASNCVNISSTQVSVKTTHASGATCASTPTLIPFPGHETTQPLTARCNAEETGDRSVQSIQATVAPQLTVGSGSLTGSSSGNF